MLCFWSTETPELTLIEFSIYRELGWVLIASELLCGDCCKMLLERSLFELAKLACIWLLKLLVVF